MYGLQEEEEMMKVDEPMPEEESAVFEAEAKVDTAQDFQSETFAARWSRPPLRAFAPDETAITFQVS